MPPACCGQVPQGGDRRCQQTGIEQKHFTLQAYGMPPASYGQVPQGGYQPGPDGVAMGYPGPLPVPLIPQVGSPLPIVDDTLCLPQTRQDGATVILCALRAASQLEHVAWDHSSRMGEATFRRLVFGRLRGVPASSVPQPQPAAVPLQRRTRRFLP